MGRADRHGDLVETPSGETWMVYLCGRTLPGSHRCVLGRVTAIQPMHWSEDGWVRTIDRGALPVAAIAGLGPEYSGPVDACDDFDQTTLPDAFQRLRTPYPEHLFSLTERPDHLLLFGHETIGSQFTQTLVARRQQAFRCTVESVTVPVGGGSIALRVEVDHDTLRFADRMLDAADWCRFPGTFDAGLLSDEATLPGLPNFTAAFVGMACQDLAGTGMPAAFDHFRYVEHPGESTDAPGRTNPTDRQTRI